MFCRQIVQRHVEGAAGAAVVEQKRVDFGSAGDYVGRVFAQQVGRKIVGGGKTNVLGLACDPGVGAGFAHTVQAIFGMDAHKKGGGMRDPAQGEFNRLGEKNPVFSDVDVGDVWNIHGLFLRKGRKECTFDNHKLFVYNCFMIRSFADRATEHFYTTGRSRRIPPDIHKRAAMRLTQLNAAIYIQDLRLPPSNRLEALKHDRRGQWSIRINDQWRICFRFENGDALDVEITDYH